MELGTIGIWWSGWQRDDGFAEAAAEMEELGYGTLWLSGGFGRGLSSRFERVLGTTTTMKVASGIIGVWQTPAAELAHAVEELDGKYPGRFLLGLGVSHAPVVEGSGQAYEHPFAKMVAFLDELDASEPTVPVGRRALAALGPRMLRLSAERSLGAHPYFTPVEHTALARETLGNGPLLAPEVAVILQPDAGRARELARTYMAGYLALPNYSNNLRRLGYGDDDLAGTASDRVVDAVVPWGDAEHVADRIREHLAAGADHVCVQVITDTGRFPTGDYRELAEALIA
jgi:probable F420-dependent oxidoreductase